MLNLKYIPHIIWTAANINSFPLQLLRCCNWADAGWGFLQRPIFQLKFNFQVKGFIQNETVHTPHYCAVSEHEISWFIISRTVQGKSKINKGKLPSSSRTKQLSWSVFAGLWSGLSDTPRVGLTRRNPFCMIFFLSETNSKKSHLENKRGVSQAKWELLF